MPKFPVKEKIIIEEGKHTGNILRVEYRHKPYEYCDMIVSVDGETSEGVELKYGCPTSITIDSNLGATLTRFGAHLVKGEEIVPEEIMMGTSDLEHTKEEEGANTIDIYSYKPGKEKIIEVTFVTTNDVVEKEGTKREYARIAQGSLKPAIKK